VKTMVVQPKKEARCFVKLQDGSVRQFPEATETRDTEGGGVEIWSEHIFLAAFRRDEFLSSWINPQFLIARKKKAQKASRARKRRR
jgi:hypothetical protein